MLRLQRQIGNTAVQQLLTRPSGAIVQRYSLGELWEDVGSLASAAWEWLTQPSAGDEEKKTDVVSPLTLPPGTFTIADAQAIIRHPPPALTPRSGQPIIPEGSQVELVEGARKNGKFYVSVRGHLGSDQASPPRDLGWTAASNVTGLPTLLASLNPAVEEPEEDIVTPKPGKSNLPGLPAKPMLEHPQFSAIVQEIEKMEQQALAVRHGEEVGADRTERVEAIAALRRRIAELGEAIADPQQLKEAQAYLYRRLAPLAPYFGQMPNTNMLEKGGEKGWKRTCNVTVPAMVIEGVGKAKDDYDASRLPLLRRVFEALEGKYKVRQKKYEAVADFDALRFPDFLALVAIARNLNKVDGLTDEEFVDAVSAARQTAARKTTSHATMMYLIDQFGASHKKHNVYLSELDKIGGAQKMYTKAVLRGQNPEEWRDLYDKIEAIDSAEEKAKAFEALNDRDKKRYKTLWNYEQLDKEQADELLPVGDYRQAVLRKVNPLLDKGAQILVGMENHFVRLDALDEDVIQVDDPGEQGFKNLQVSWEQARNLGYFKGFWEITG